MPFLDALLKRGGGDFIKELSEEVLGRLMAYDIEGRIGAARYERNDERTTQRNGYRERAFDTRLGTLDLKVPKIRRGSYFPGFLEPRRTTEQALVAVIEEAWIQGGACKRLRPARRSRVELQAEGSRRARSTILCRRWDVVAYPKVRCPSCARGLTHASGPSLSDQSRENVRTLARRDLP